MTHRSESIASLAAAMAKAQGALEAAKKDANNPHFKSRYADLASVWDACRDALSVNGIAVIQSPETDQNGTVAVTTTLAHGSGEWISSTMACKPAKADAQAMGSVITYLRRYALAAMVGVAPEDDDGNAASGKGQPADMTPTGKPAKADSPLPSGTVAPDGASVRDKMIAAINRANSLKELDSEWDAIKADFRLISSHQADNVTAAYDGKACDLLLTVIGKATSAEALRDAWAAANGYMAPMTPDMKQRLVAAKDQRRADLHLPTQQRAA